MDYSLIFPSRPHQVPICLISKLCKTFLSPYLEIFLFAGEFLKTGIVRIYFSLVLWDAPLWSLETAGKFSEQVWIRCLCVCVTEMLTFCVSIRNTTSRSQRIREEHSFQAFKWQYHWSLKVLFLTGGCLSV